MIGMASVLRHVALKQEPFFDHSICNFVENINNLMLVWE